jgi:hypothetical protein
MFNYSYVEKSVILVGRCHHLVHTSVSHSTVIISPVDIKILRIRLSPDPPTAE